MVIYLAPGDELVIRYPHEMTLDCTKGGDWKLGIGDPLWQYDERVYHVTRITPQDHG